jgi:tripartite-type tricarboxylate transporter receptor subunit TctC
MKTKNGVKIVVGTVTLLILAMGAKFSLAEQWPSKPITIIHPWAAGGASDLITRAFAEGLEKRLRVPVIVENKPGGSGLIGAAAAANAKPEGPL